MEITCFDEDLLNVLLCYLVGHTTREVAKPGEVGDHCEEQCSATAGCAGGAHRQTCGAHQPASYYVQGTVQD